MDNFTLYAAGLEKDRVDRILNICKEESIVDTFTSQPTGSYGNPHGRVKYVVTTPKEKDSVSVRRRIGCSYAGLGRSVYFRVDEYDRYESPPEKPLNNDGKFLYEGRTKTLEGKGWNNGLD